jgi:hypothetical protein
VKKLISLLVVAALAATFLVPGTVGAWNLSSGETDLVATTPLGVMVAQGMTLVMSLLPKWVNTDFCSVSVETFGQTGWDTEDVGAMNVTGVTREGAQFVAGLGDIITWGMKILADLVRIMGGAPSKPAK